MQTAINLFTLSDFEKTHTLSDVLELCADAGYDGVEFLHRFPEADLESVKRTLESSGLTVPGAHLGPFISLDEQPAELERTIEMYAAVDCGALAISVGDQTYFETANRIAETARKLESLAETAADYDIDFLYHNHHWEFQPLSGTDTVIFDVLMAELDDSVGVELDVGWVAAGGDDPVERIELLGDRLEILHVKDVDIAEKRSVEVGEGGVDLASCVDAALAAGVDWFVYEHDEPDDPLTSLETGARFITDL
ncbi:sugar phosphate isomerase/epimerase family protein [Haloprofundus salilacus]|uniref:sugar phosphate isomerase/epimerase family protein n=1 Tax=Haloprofundus salilacus TaxID=2876190 RepID=UPI001CC9DF6B|nr:sugar phosphate isomerase/epimerase [Haloprofundus salilacus]